LPAVWISLPDGRVVRSDDASASDELSRTLSRKVALKQVAPESAHLEQYWPEHAGQNNEVTAEAVAGDAPAGSFFDYATVHLLTTSTLDELRAAYPQGRFEVRRFRPNMVSDTAGAKGFIENDWVGKTLQIGENVRLQITDPCPRCVMTTLAQGDLPPRTPAFSSTASRATACTYLSQAGRCPAWASTPRSWPAESYAGAIRSACCKPVGWRPGKAKNPPVPAHWAGKIPLPPHSS
jgi:uncharacterized protein YcbX